MIRRLVESHYFENRDRAAARHVTFWLRELRTPSLLIQVAKLHPARCGRLSLKRPLLTYASTGEAEKLERALAEEESAERERDKVYWLPLRQELEKLRHAS
jgi:hypothetical protein